MKSIHQEVIHLKNKFAGELYRENQQYCKELPSMKETQRWVKDMVNLLFPIKFERDIDLHATDARLDDMKKRLEGLLGPMGKDLNMPSYEIVDSFFSSLPKVYHLLLEDAETFLKSDPAAVKLEEVILCYPGFFSLAVHRMAHLLYRMNVPVVPRVMSEYAHSKTGIDIHPGAMMGKNCFIDHGTGIVIGETAIVGNNVKIYQGVTLGALYVEKEQANTKRHPTIEDNVILYSACTILGGNTHVGHDTIIGGNVWLTESVLPYSIVYRQNKTIVKDSRPQSGPNDFII